MYYIEIMFLGLGLSMDAFSLAISTSLVKKIHNKKKFIIAFVVGIFHFFMPCIGFLFKSRLYQIIFIPPKILLSLVIFMIILGILLDKENKITDKILNPLVFGFSVSIDSFTIGLSLKKCSVITSSIIFMIISLLMTVSGFMFGEKITNKYESKCKYISVLILITFLIVKLIS